MAEANYGVAHNFDKRLAKWIHPFSWNRQEPKRLPRIAERSIGLAGVTTQLLLGMTNLKVDFWCFALLHCVILLSVRPNAESGVSPFEALFKKTPNLMSLRIFGSTMYKVD
jgi:hypothetical protein